MNVYDNPKMIQTEYQELKQENEELKLELNHLKAVVSKLHDMLGLVQTQENCAHCGSLILKCKDESIDKKECCEDSDSGKVPNVIKRIFDLEHIVLFE